MRLCHLNLPCRVRFSGPITCPRRWVTGPLKRTLLLVFALQSSALADEKITYDQHIRPIFNTSCMGCHNPDKAKAGLDLSGYQKVIAGSTSAKVLEPGDAENSLLYLLVTHREEPHMPQNGGKLPDAQLELIRKWIAGGALESS